jgi:Uncharacterized ACR, COG1678
MQTLRGHLLIATPHLRSPIFARSVILMLDQNEEGALGVILNQPINTTMTDLSGKIFVADFEWNFGKWSSTRSTPGSCPSCCDSASCRPTRL